MSTTPMLRCLPAHLARAALVLFTLCTLAGLGRSAAQDPLLPPTNGPRRLDPTSIDGHGAGMHALVGGTIHPRPGEVIEKGTVLIRDGVIETVRAATPQDLDRTALVEYQVHDCTGLHLYAGFIDPFIEIDAPRPDVNAPGSHWNPTVTPQRSALDGSATGVGRAFGNPPVDDATGQTLRSMGFVAAGLSPRGGIFRGAGATVSLGRPTGDLSAAPVPVYVPKAYHAVGFDQARDGNGPPDDERWGDYPSSEMGAIALIRQTLIDAKWQADMVRDGYRTAGESCLDQLATDADGNGKTLWFDTGDELEALRADTIAREFERALVVVGSGREFRRLSAIKSSGRAMVIPLSFAERPRVTTQGEAESVDLERMMMWEQGPTNPRRLAQAGVEFALTTSKVPDKLGGRAGFAEKLRTVVKHGLTADQALTALTVTPAKLLGVQDRLGTLEKGKIASIVLSDKALFQDRADRGEDKPEKAKGDAGGSEEKVSASESPPDAKEGAAKEDAQAFKPADGVKSKGKTDHAAAKDKPARVMEVWIDGRRHEIIARPEVEIAGTWEIRFAMPKREEGDEAPAAPQQRFRAEIEIDDQVPPGITIRKVNLDGTGSAAPKETTEANKTGNAKAKSDDDTVTAKAREVRMDGNRLSFIFDHTPLGEPGFFRNAAVFERERRNDPTSELVMHATVERAGGGKAVFTARRIKPWEAAPEKQEEQAEPKLGSEAAEIAAIPSALPVPFGAYGRIANEQKKSADAMPAQENLAIVNTTVWTANDMNEVIEQGAVVISAGKITYVGPSASMPKLGSDYRILDLNGGSHVTPGIIDAHSHTGISKGVNEAGQAVTSEVRIQDVTDPDSISWYRQLAGGTTCVNSMHGSANPIGGQTQTNKIRWGVEHPDQMHMEGATPGIKFALGENVKQSNWGPRSVTRYPQTRMGVETLIRDRFQAAKEYMWTDEKRLKWELLRDNANWGRGYNDKAPETFTREQAKSVKERSPEVKDWPERKPRRNLELEALEEIIRGRRLIHCHSYRQDEILMLCRIADEFNFKIGTFQHGLECYKVADEVRTHALGASIFTDWWAYKVEVQDAIPQAGAILHDQGVSVSFNSDSDELARRLNYEAAKGIKYSGGQPGGEGETLAARIDPATALRFVTINAATQLGIERRVGSLEVGKDADLVVWTVSPLSAYTRVVETYVDGRKMFSIEEDMQLRERIERERTRLIQKILAQEAREKGSPLMQVKQKDGEGEAKGERPPASRRSLMERMKSQAADLRREQNLDLLRRGLDPRFSRCTDCGESSLGQW